ncbi:uncharacterized protein LOC124458378 [Xenia sp. Carnegie-2017]|uniref:uncharacterized protein LOC124458378 n=1 Tax=Xenia sp. Carnegie-2017 TaxID=2897299 RepID=UPI001F04FFC4|nr:uncharacterized protein LOC124458378 [Xenia sp. Carnegie-2017]
MPKYNCCVPGCSDSHRNKPRDFKFYCLPKDLELRKKYDVLIRNDNLKVASPNTRICCDHWEGGKKLSRTHLPSVFPWTVHKEQRREITRASQEKISKHKRKRKNFMQNYEVDIESEQLQNDQASHLQSSATQTDLACFCKAKDHVLLLQDVKKQIIEEQIFLESELLRLTKLLEITKSNLARQQQRQSRFDIDKYKSSDSDIEFYTGLSNYKMLTFCFNLVEESRIDINGDNTDDTQIRRPKLGRPRALSCYEEYILVLMRLRLGLFEKDLAHRFGVAVGTVSNIIRKWIKLLRAKLGSLIRMPERDTIKYYSPPAFKQLFPQVVIVIDCTEIEMERPSALNNQSACYSSYKSRPTMKVLIGITPSGVLSYISELFPGSTSDLEIVKKSNFLDILSPGDSVMADRGFNIKDELASVGAFLEAPSFLQKKTQFTQEEINKNKAIPSLRIHVERQMERLKNWHILDRKIPITMAPLASDALVVIAALANFLPPLVC